MIQVTAAVIKDGEKVLVCKRPKEKHHGGQWEFPGGKVEPGETLFDCIIRECREELGITLAPKQEIICTDNENISLHFIEAEIAYGELTLNEHEAVEWISKSDVERFEFCPADKRALEYIW